MARFYETVGWLFEQCGIDPAAVWPDPGTPKSVAGRGSRGNRVG
jgi:hypothetical protein